MGRFSEILVILGVFLEGTESFAEIKRKPAQWVHDEEPALHGRFVPEAKPTWQKILAFIGWIILLLGLVGEAVFRK
jgi:hypothetical protein